jgi:hypothetical protein
MGCSQRIALVQRSSYGKARFHHLEAGLTLFGETVIRIVLIDGKQYLTATVSHLAVI